MALPRRLIASLAAMLAAATLTAALPRAQATCMSAPVGYVVLTPDVRALAGGGAVVATHAFVPADKRVDGLLRLRVRGKVVAADPRTLAPGLVVYELPAGAASGELVLGKRVVGKLRAVKGAHTALAAPAATAITVLTSPVSAKPEPSRGGTHEQTTVILDKPAPAGAVALIMFDEQGTAVTFASVSPGVTGALPIYEAYRCETHPPGHSGLHAGAKATLAWVDRAGMVGARSAPIALAGVPRPD